MSMKRIISVSRRTDVPAFYTEWFLRRMNAGFAGWENPFGGQKYLVSLRPEDILALVFWSKNYRPFLPVLETVRATGSPVMFNYTITGLPQEFEADLVPPEDAIDSLRTLSRLYSPDHVTWRYDPIVTSQPTDAAYHEERFAWLAGQIKGYVKRCYFSFAIMYGKVQRNFAKFDNAHAVGFYDMDLQARVALASRLADIASANGIEMFTCCGDYLVGGRIKKAHCVDGDVISRLFYGGAWHGVERPTRKECGCTESTDIGRYDTCPHGCIYCYANVNKEQAEKSYNAHDPESVFLGYPKAQADRFVQEIELRAKEQKVSVPAPANRQLGFTFGESP